MKTANLIFPHQLFEDSPLIGTEDTFFIVEEFLFFNQFAFHKQKIAFHRASMKQYEARLVESGKDVSYVEASEAASDIRVLLTQLAEGGFERVRYVDPTDNWLEKRILQSCEELGMEAVSLDSPLFLNTRADLESFFDPQKKKFSQTSFYIGERTRRKVLLDQDDKPRGGSWTYDKENRKKYPAKKQPPAVHFPEVDSFYKEAINYVSEHFPDNPGEMTSYPLYPTGFNASRAWLQQFLEYRFAEFGPYEDAIVARDSILNHSVLSPMLNVGLLTPEEILRSSLDFAEENDIPLNSTEGFVRQIMGWREFLRGIYEVCGSEQRTRNYWEFKRKIPSSFYYGTTGIEPLDQTIRKVLRTGYCHHIERLMVLGNFMLLCEFDPDEVYRWFMELFIDAYDWVMVPNVYGMSQFSDGGLMATKPYISGSNYLMKMSDYKKGKWQATWDGLFWRFMHVHRDFFTQNPRLGMLVRMFDKLPAEKRSAHLENAEAFLGALGSD